MIKGILLKPFEKYSEIQLSLFGTIFLLIGCYSASFCHANFDGFFDLHFTSYQYSFIEILAQNLINISVLFVCLFLAGMYRYKKTRTIDILNTVLIARVPFYFLALFNVNNSLSVDPMLNADELMEYLIENIVLLSIMTLILISILIWMIALLYNGFKISTNAKGNNEIAIFIVALLLAEVFSKLIIYKTIQ